jgi:hypothetical protein
MTPEQDKKIEDLYHEILKHLNKVSSHPVMRGIPELQNEFKGATECLIEFRKLTRESL